MLIIRNWEIASPPAPLCIYWLQFSSLSPLFISAAAAIPVALYLHPVKKKSTKPIATVSVCQPCLSASAYGHCGSMISVQW